MEGFNKYQALTVAVILMFVFVVAAIYTNTKDASAQKINEKSKQSTTYQTSEAAKTSDSINDLYNEVEFINQRLDEMNKKVTEASSEYATCKIYGVMTDNGPEQVSTSQAIEIARENGVELVFACNL